MPRRTLRFDPLGVTTRSGWFRRPAVWNHAAQTLTLASGREIPYRHIRVRLIHPRPGPFDVTPRFEVFLHGKEVQVALAGGPWLRLHQSRGYERLVHVLESHGVKVEMRDAYVPAKTFQTRERRFRRGPER